MALDSIPDLALPSLKHMQSVLPPPKSDTLLCISVYIIIINSLMGGWKYPDVMLSLPTTP